MLWTTAAHVSVWDSCYGVPHCPPTCDNLTLSTCGRKRNSYCKQTFLRMKNTPYPAHIPNAPFHPSPPTNQSTSFYQVFLAHLYNLQHLLAADVPVSVKIIHAECPFQLLLQLASWRHAQGDDELPEVYRTIAIGVKSSEDVLSELGGVTVGEEIGIDFLELLHIQGATRAILQESLRKRRQR